MQNGGGSRRSVGLKSEPGMGPAERRQANQRAVRVALALIAAVAAFVAFRYEVYRESKVFTLAEYFTFSAPLPFGHRILPALIGHPLVHGIGISARSVAIAIDFGSLLAACLLLARLFRGCGDCTAALLGGGGLLAPLALALLVPSRHPVLFAYDLPAVALAAAGLVVAVERRLAWLVPLTALAALNRPTAVLLPLLYLVLNLGNESSLRLIRTVAIAVAAAVAVALGLAFALPDLGGQGLPLVHDGEMRLLRNLEWLTSGTSALRLLTTMAWLPLLWLALRHRISSRFRAIEPLALLLMVQILVFGNLYEPRVFAELAVYLYAPIVLTLAGPVDTAPRPGGAAGAWLRWATLAILVGSALVCAFLVHLFRLGKLS